MKREHLEQQLAPAVRTKDAQRLPGGAEVEFDLGVLVAELAQPSQVAQPFESKLEPWQRVEAEQA